MSLCEMCIHCVLEEEEPVYCLSGVKYIPRTMCRWYEVHPNYGIEQAKETMTKWRESFVKSVKEREKRVSVEIEDLDNLFHIEDVNVNIHENRKMIRLVGDFFMTPNLTRITIALFNWEIIGDISFSRNSRLKQSELRIKFKKP